MSRERQLPAPVAQALLILIEHLAGSTNASDDQVAGSAEAAPESPPSPWLNTESAAAYLDWPRQRLYKLTARGQIPHYKHEGRLLFHRQELDDWLTHYAEGHRD